MSFLSSILHPPVLENTGSVARDHLALERTYLAWLRTSLTLTSVGIALSQFFRLPKGWADDEELRSDEPSRHPHGPSYWLGGETVRDLATPMGSSFVVIGIITLLFGTWRYFAVQRQLMRTSYVPSRLEGECSRMWGKSRPLLLTLLSSPPLPSPFVPPPAITITFLVGTLLFAVLAVILAAPAGGQQQGQGIGAQFTPQSLLT